MLPGLPVLAQTIPNAGFEANTFTNGVGYISQNTAITGWTENLATRVGLNPAGAQSPFANNGTIPEGLNVAFLQASSGQVGSLTTSISGLAIGTTYVLSFYANARMDGDNTAGLQVSVGGIGLNLYGASGAPLPALVTAGAYQVVHGMFTATAASHSLVVANNLSSGDHTLLVDGFSIAAVGDGAIDNPGFEENTFTNGVGYISTNTPINDWTANDSNRVGQNPAGSSPFADNGAIPQGANVALLQASGGVGSLTTTVTGLSPGAKYNVSLRTNARGGNTPWLTFSTNGAGAAVTASVTPVGGANPYRYASFEFVATAASQVMTITNNAPAGDNTLLVDDFAIEPSSGSWGFAPWTGDADSGVSSQFVYTHAYSFGGTPLTINGVHFLSGEGEKAGGFTLSGLNNVFPNRTPNNVAGDSANLAKDFRYGGATGIATEITIEDLEPNTDYVFTLYGIGFDVSDPRSATFSSSVDSGAEKFTANLTQYGQGNGMLVTYTYTTDSLGTPVTISYPATGPGTFHTSGFSNRKAAPSAPPAAWTTAAWSNDASSGVAGSYHYTHAFNFGSTVSPNIDGVVFTGIAGANPAGPGLTSTIVNTYANDLNNAITGYGAPISRDFVHGGNPEVINLSGLTPGKDYVFTLYSTGWDAPGDRYNAFYGNPGEGHVWLDQNQFGLNQGIRIEYRYTADATGSVKIMSFPRVTNYNMHVCGISNREAAPLVASTPVITLDPVGATVGVGAGYMLRAEGTGSGRTYQWKLAGIDISGANSPVLELTDIQFADAGDYTLTITNEVLASATSAAATLVVQDSIPGFFATGVGVDGQPLAGGAIDPHFTLITNPNNPASDDVFVQSAIPSPPWVANSPTSKWVGPVENTFAADAVTDAGEGVGVYVYRTRIDLTNFDLSTVKITGGWATDNGGLDIRVNGNSTGLTNTAQFGGLTPFTIDIINAPSLHAGVNTIDFVVRNDPPNGYTGLRIDNLQTSGLIAPGTAPHIAVQPVGAIGPHDGNAVFAVGASGSAIVGYQWYENNVLMPGEIGAILEVLVSDPTYNGRVYKVKVSNGSGNLFSANATLTVPNANPVANQDATDTDQGMAIEIPDTFLLLNDTDADGDPLEVTAVDATSANGGTVSLDLTGRITYTPPAGFGGQDSFGYTVSDGIWGGTDTGTVVVTIPTSLQLWRLANGFAADGSGPKQGNLEDFDDDGLSNLLEFGFGTNPKIMNAGPLSWDGVGDAVPGTPVVHLSYPGGGGVDFKARFMRRKDHDNPGSAHYRLEFSSDLSDWETSDELPTPAWAADLPVHLADDASRDYELVEVPYPLFLDGGKKAQFFRVTVTTP